MMAENERDRRKRSKNARLLTGRHGQAAANIAAPAYRQGLRLTRYHASALMTFTFKQ